MTPSQRSRVGGLLLALCSLVFASGNNTTTVTTPSGASTMSELDKMREALEEVKDVVEGLQRLVNSHLTTPPTATPTFPGFLKPHPPQGVVYVRWGRKSCPPDTETVYSGVTGGGYHAYTGSSPNPLCLPMNPIYANFTPNNNGTNYLYGTEYYSYNNLPNFHNHYQDVPCAVCVNPRRSLAFMLPARTTCVPGWHVEYFGYLMAGKHDNTASVEYICVDHQPENVDGGQSHQGYSLLYFVKTSCTTSLRCPPYKSGQEVTCALCSK